MNASALYIRLILTAVCVALAGAGCEVGGVTFSETGQAASEVIAVRATAAAADTAAARAAGLDPAGLAGTRIRAAPQRTGNIPPFDALSADSAGVAVFGDLQPSGPVRTAGLRVLTSEEIEAASDRYPTLRAFAGGTKLSASIDTQPLPLARNATGSLVITEVTGFSYVPSPIYSGFYELYNNSSRTVYLDGKILGRAHSAWAELDGFPCAVQQAKVDREGIWSRFFQRFPGSGTDYPVGPGETVLVANQALDHTEARDYLANLEDADFELEGGPDNADVPNLTNAGPQPVVGAGIQIGLGFQWAPFIAEPVDVDALPEKRLLTRSDDVLVRIPREKVIDVVTTIDDDDGHRLCTNKLHPVFDRLAKTLHDLETKGTTIQRRPVGTAPGGWTIYLDSNTSEADFVVAPMTPGEQLQP